MADDLSARGSGLRARQTKGSPHAPENLTPTPAVNLRVYKRKNGFVREKRWFVLKIPRGDTNGVGEDEVTATSGLHADDDDEDDVYRYYIGE